MLSLRPRRRVLLAAAAVLSVAAPGNAAASLPTPMPGPDISALSPNHGPADGGNTVTIGGIRLDLGTRVQFDGEDVPIRGKSANQIVVSAPAGLSGTTVDVRVDAGYQYSSGYSTYTYDGHTRRPVTASPERGTPAGGTEVTLTGDGIDFAGTKSVTIGRKPATIVRSTATQVLVKTPAGTPRARAQIAVETADGNFEGSLTSRFIYNANSVPPVITGVSPSTNWSGFGPVYIEGSALDEATGVTIGGQDATSFGNSGDRVYFQPPVLAPGRYDVQLTTYAGTSANTPADDLTIKAVPPAPVIDSVSPGAVRQFDLDEVTIRGRNLTEVQFVTVQNSELNIVHVSDTELRVKMEQGIGVGVYRVTAYSPGGSSVNRPDDPTDDLEILEHPDNPSPSPLTLTPNHGPVQSDTVVTIALAGSDIVLRRVNAVKIGSGDTFREGWVEWNPPYQEVKLHLPPGIPGTTEQIRLYRYTGPYELKQVNSDQDFFTWDADGGPTPTPEPTPTPTVSPTPSPSPSPSPTPMPEQIVDYGYRLAGSATLKSLTKGSLPLTGGIDAKLGVPSGKFTGALTLATSTGNLTALGFLPVAAKVNLVPTEPVTGTLKSGKLTAVAKVRIKLPSVKTFGIELAGGANCQAKQISSITLTSTQPTFLPLSGGPIAGTFDISDLSGCGFLTGIVSPLTKGSGNAIALQLTPKQP